MLEQWSQISEFSFILRNWEEKIGLKVSKREEIIKIRAKTNEVENRKTTEKINETKIYFLTCSQTIQEKIEKKQVIKIRNDIDNIKTGSIDRNRFLKKTKK